MNRKNMLVHLSKIIHCLWISTCMKTNYKCYVYTDTSPTIIDTRSTLSHLMSRGMPIYFHPFIGHGWMCTAKFFSDNVAKSNDFFCVGNVDLFAPKQNCTWSAHLSGGIWQIFGSGTDIGMFAPSADEVWRCLQKKVRGITSLSCSVDGPFEKEWQQQCNIHCSFVRM